MSRSVEQYRNIPALVQLGRVSELDGRGKQVWKSSCSTKGEKSSK